MWLSQGNLCVFAPENPPEEGGRREAKRVVESNAEGCVSDSRDPPAKGESRKRAKSPKEKLDF